MNQPGDVDLRSKGLSIQLTAWVPAVAGCLLTKYTHSVFHLQVPVPLEVSSFSSHLPADPDIPQLAGAVLLPRA